MTFVSYQDAPSAPLDLIPMGYQHWRIDVLGTVNGSYFCCDELQFREVVGVPQQATGGVASARTVYGAGYEADKAFDGNPAWFYNSAAGDANTAWLRYSFAAPIKVKQVAITPLNSVPGQQQSPNAFDLKYSPDGVSWIIAKSFTGITGWVGGVTKTFDV